MTHHRTLPEAEKVQPNTNLLNIRLQKELGRYLLIKPFSRKKYKTVRGLKKHTPKFCDSEK